MDCRVKPGNDAQLMDMFQRAQRWEAGRATRVKLVRAASFRT